MDVSAWLRQLGLGEYAAAFAANHIDLATLRQLTVDDLRDLGINSVGHRRRLLEAIAQLDRTTSESGAAARYDTERRPVAVLFADQRTVVAIPGMESGQEVRAPGREHTAQDAGLDRKSVV